MSQTKVFIISDGGSDFEVLKHFISSLIFTEQNVKLAADNFFEAKRLGFNIGGDIAGYYKNNDKKKLARNILAVLHTMYKKYAEEEHITNKDIIILNSDAEKLLSKEESFYEAEWIRDLYYAIHLAIDLFYKGMLKEGKEFRNLPIIIPLILFPSIEILVGACYFSEKEKKEMRSLKATDLKTKIWGRTDMKAAFENQDVDEVLEICFGNQNNSLNDIYKHIPEVRSFIHILSCSSVI